MSFRPLALSPIVLLFACGPKDSSSTAAAKSSMDHVPADAASLAFANNLVDLKISGWSPADAAGAKFEYLHMSFEADGTWSADGYVEIADERMECNETGGWQMNPATDADTATISWKVGTTDCAGREIGIDTRAQFTLSRDGTFKALFR